MNTSGLDLLAVMAHPDDAELLCGGTLRRAADQGHRTGILDLTRGEAGSRGTAGQRAREAERAAEILGLALRRNAGLPDGALQNSLPARATVAEQIRALQPRVIITHGPNGRHPDHRAAKHLVYDAAFLAGLRNAPVPGEPFRPLKVVYALAYLEPPRKPSFVVDITEQMDRKLAAIFAYQSQFEGVAAAGEVFPGDDRPLREQITAADAACGALVRKRFGEPFLTRETLRVYDITLLDVASF